MKAAAAHHPIIQIQKEVDDLLAKGVIQPSPDGASFYSSVFVVPTCTGGFQSIPSLQQFSHYLHTPSLKMPTISHVWELIQHGDYDLSIDL